MEAYDKDDRVMLWEMTAPQLLSWLERATSESPETIYFEMFNQSARAYVKED